jgi:membrane protein implicated in regulation of membrane protease activity
MSGSVMIWVVLAVIALFLEMLTRTFTLMALAIGFGVAALLGWMGFGFLLELIGGLIVGGLCMVWLRKSPKGQALQEAEESRYSVISDDGDEVYISKWDDGEQVDVVVKGHNWRAKLAPGSNPKRGMFKVREVREGQLILEEKPHEPDHHHHHPK